MFPVPPPALDSLNGLALGDAFGDRWFHPPVDEASADVAARLVRPGPWHWTDDTAMSLVLVRHLRDRGEVEPAALAREFAAEYAVAPHRKYGPSMHRVMRAVHAGEDHLAVTRALFDGQGSHGNGAAMRVAPLGAWFADDLAVVAEQAARSATATHAHPEAAAGACAVALAAALAVRSRGGAATPRAEFLREVAGLLPESEVRSGLRIAAALPPGTSVRHASVVLGSGFGVSAQDTVPFALWSAAGHPDDLAEALWQTLTGWGDMDTTCAIAAGVVAARTGLAGVPAGWSAAREPLPAL
ncbi:ADP-ribosylglycohydrolase family protein [Kitasatospora cheerisanensis]|uniref:Putative hydrolase n=1 Tax=Kitasatospora cheerisanensis KCTC 2395 TaxID=1348663 RepID=A0A066YPI4_9ACTN|nr:ADP-ribosylglycohydrolase family protein [Kitasatospora cheerisanensis]KDN81894.1 putative hydrolase [Kitasatospora cheerisanensis KCTC 2395]